MQGRGRTSRWPTALSGHISLSFRVRAVVEMVVAVLAVTLGGGWAAGSCCWRSSWARCVSTRFDIAGRLFLHEHPWVAWSRGFSFVKEMAEKDGVCRFQLPTDRVEKGSMSNSGCFIEGLGLRCCSRDGQAGLKREIDSLKAVGSMEVGVPCEESNVLEIDEYAEELQNVFDNISGVRLDPELVHLSRQVEIDFMSRLNVYRKRSRHWVTDKGIPVIPTQWVDVNKGNARQPEYRPGMCGKELKR